jgi:hypothetical protein
MANNAKAHPFQGEEPEPIGESPKRRIPFLFIAKGRDNAPSRPFLPAIPRAYPPSRNSHRDNSQRNFSNERFNPFPAQVRFILI